jgi:hypothetical protein
VSDGDGPRRGLSDPTVDIVPGEAPRRGGGSAGSAPSPIAATEPEQAVSSAGRRSPFDHSSAPRFGGAGRFEPRGELGRGGMGRVDDAFDTALDRPVAIKQLLRGDDLDVTRFEREVRITARLEHPGIVPIHDAGRNDDGTPYYVMRRIDGRPLDQVMATATLADRLALIPNVLAACDAMAYAHARGVVHRDIKPTNILIGPFGETLVIDWGLAREIDPDAAKSGFGMPMADDGANAKTAAGTIAGTPGFMAPEQARGELVDARADVFALGATLFYVVAARSPYPGDSATEMVYRAGTAQPADWRAWPRGVPQDLRAIVAKALAPDPAARYADAGELASDLRRYVTGKLVDAHRYGAAARLVRFVRRHRAAVAVSVVSALALAVVATVLVRRIVDERDDATEARALADSARATAEQRQREATEVADAMLVERARALAATDPAGAIVLLRRLDPASTHWREGWLAAVSAQRHGVPIGFRLAEHSLWLELSADGRFVVTTGANGAIEVIDVAARTARTLPPLPEVGACRWLGDATLACDQGKDDLALIDVATGAQHPIRGLHVWESFDDRRGREVVSTADRRVLEIHADGSRRELATGVDLAAVSGDLGLIVWRRGDAIEAWTPAAGARVVGSFGHAIENLATTVAAGDWFAAYVGSGAAQQIVRWHVTRDAIVEAGRWPAGGAMQLNLVGDHLYARDGTGVRALDVPLVGLQVTPQNIVQMERGFVAVEQDNTVAVFHDGAAFVRLGPSPVELVRADESPDGRAVAALTALDELVVWDADAVRPRIATISNGEDPLRVTGNVLWSNELGRGLVWHDLDTGSNGVAITAPPTLEQMWTAVANDGSWAAMRDPDSGDFHAYDARTREVGAMPAGAAAALDQVTNTLVVVTDGRFARWRAGADDLERIGTVPEGGKPVTGIAVDGHAVVMAEGARDVERVELPSTPRGRATLPDDVHDAVALRDGRAWIMTAAGVVWEWPLDAPPRKAATGEPADELLLRAGHVLARGQHALVVLDTSPPRAIALDARRISALDDGFAVATSSTGMVSLLDLERGQVLPLDAFVENDGLCSDHERLVLEKDSTRARELHIIDLPVPHDPVALRAWLAGATNARDSAATSGVTWP